MKILVPQEKLYFSDHNSEIVRPNFLLFQRKLQNMQILLIMMVAIKSSDIWVAIAVYF